MRSADGTELLERLLQDAGFRARFRHDPAAAAREAGFPELAERLAADATLSLEPLELRESRSSIGGVMLAAAVEGLGLFELADQFGDEAHAAVRPRGDGAGSALHDEAAEPLTVPDDDVEPEQDERALAPDDATEPDEQEPDDDEPDEEEPDEEEPDEEEPDEEEPDEEEPDEEEPDEDDEDDERELVDRGEPDESDADGDQDDAGDEGDSDESDGSPAPALDPGDNWRPTPDQYGMAGGGGPRSPIDAAVLDNARITLDADGRRDFASGRMDPRVGQVLLRLAEKHRITLSAATSDHAQNTAGGSPSNHWYGRAVDIATVDGEIVRPGSAAGREVAAELQQLDASIRPDEVGTPWAFSAPGFFTDSDHQDHIHVAFDGSISRSWKPRSETRVMRALAPDEVDEP